MSRYVPSGTYGGEDLMGRSARPGAYDAMAIPSRMGERRLLPAEMKAELRAAPCVAMPLPARSATSVAVPTGATATPIPATPPDPAPVDAPAVAAAAASPLPTAEPAPPPVATAPQGEVFKLGRRKAKTPPPTRELTPIKGRGITPYTPRHGSVPHVIVEHLRANGGCVTYSAAAAMTGANPGHLTAICKPALLGGLLMRHHVDGKLVLSLADWTPPSPPDTASTPALDLQRLADALASSASTLTTSMGQIARALENACGAIERLQGAVRAHQQQQGAANHG